ncbi:MAG: OmpA family protein [Rubricella sp.]
MRRIALTLVALVWVLSGFLAYRVAVVSVDAIEERSEEDVIRGLEAAGLDWAEVETDGLIVRLAGTAPAETARFRALDVAGLIVGQLRLEDTIEVATAIPQDWPDPTLQILRAGSQTTLVGIVPEGRTAPLSVAVAAPGTQVVNLLETTAATPGQGWTAAVDAGLDIASAITIGTITIEDGAVRLEAVFPDMDSLEAFRRDVLARLPQSVALEADISAPPRLLSPFTLDVEAEAGDVRLVVCHARSETEAQEIDALADRLAADEPHAACEVGGGGPDGWPTAARAAIVAADALGDGRVTIEDGAVTVAPAGSVSQDRALGAMGLIAGMLPEGFTLSGPTAEPAVMPPAIGEEPLFTAILLDGSVSISGQVGAADIARAVEAHARALFGVGSVSAELAPGGPVSADDIFKGLSALARLRSGELAIHEGLVRIGGIGTRPDIESLIAAELARRPEGSASAEISVVYEPQVYAGPERPGADACEAEIASILEERQITFAPSSAVIDAESAAALDAIAAVMRRCVGVRFVIEGHTDSSGAADVNLAISSARAEAVLDALLGRGVFLDVMTAEGYGETRPEYDNETPEGRALNRRIEIRALPQEEEAAE